MSRKVYTRVVLDMTLDDIPVVESDSFDYDGPWSLCEEGDGGDGGTSSNGDGGLSGHDGRSSVSGSRGNGFGRDGSDSTGDDGGWSTGGYSLGEDGVVTGPGVDDGPRSPSDGWAEGIARDMERSEDMTDLAEKYAESIKTEKMFDRLNPKIPSGLDLGLGLRNNFTQSVDFDGVMGAAAEAQHNNQDVGLLTKFRDAFQKDPRFSALGMMKATADTPFDAIKSGYGSMDPETGALKNDNIGQFLGVVGTILGLRNVTKGPVGIAMALSGLKDVAQIASMRNAVSGTTPGQTSESPSATPSQGPGNGGDGYDQGTAYAQVTRNTESPSSQPGGSGVSLAMQRRAGQNLGYKVGYPQSFGYNPYA